MKRVTAEWCKDNRKKTGEGDGKEGVEARELCGRSEKRKIRAETEKLAQKRAKGDRRGVRKANISPQNEES